MLRLPHPRPEFQVPHKGCDSHMWSPSWASALIVKPISPTSYLAHALECLIGHSNSQCPNLNSWSFPITNPPAKQKQSAPQPAFISVIITVHPFTQAQDQGPVL